MFLAPATLPAGPPRYIELEAGAGGHWLALSFCDVRARAAELRDADMRVSGAVKASCWIGRLRIPMIDVTRIAGSPPWRGLAAAVIGGARGDRTYLTSAAMPGERPDFHRPERWPILG